MPTYKEFVSDDVGRRQLTSLVEEDRHTDDEQFVPPRVKTSVVQDFVEKVLQPSLKVERLQRLADVARFYVLRPSVARFMQLANRRERDANEYYRSIEVLRLAGDIGNAQEEKTAAEYYDYMLNQPRFPKAASQLVICFFHLSSALEKGVADRLRKHLQSIHPGPGEPGGPSDEYTDYETLSESILPVVAHAKKHRERVLTEKDPQRRASLLARAYLGIDDPGGIDWPRWASYELMAELQRSSDKNAVAALRDALSVVDPKTEPAEYVDLARSRATRAIAFFGGQLTEEENEWQAFGEVRRHQLEG
ncbi:MAG TPA: hypothetical protein VNT79_17815 [Phycisphaerae bacterium]|nr:hypothetical protein [Phycisphaerae bacterium]